MLKDNQKIVIVGRKTTDMFMYLYVVCCFKNHCKENAGNETKETNLCQVTLWNLIETTEQIVF